MSGSKVWDDAAVKDLTFAIIMSTTDNGNINIAANWEKVSSTMQEWGYSFTKSAMSQHWTKKIVKDFKSRHADGDADLTTPVKGPTPRKRATPKTPGTDRSKKRVADDDESSADGGDVADSMAKKKTPRSAKKVKYSSDGEDAEVKAEEQESEAEPEAKAEKEDSPFQDSF